MSFCVENQVVEAALLSRILRYEKKLMEVEPRVSMTHCEYITYDRCCDEEYVIVCLELMTF